MKKDAKRFVSVGVLLLMIVAVCAGCDGSSNSSPTSPLSFINVAGPWYFAGQLTRNTCNFDAISPISGTITFNQSDAIVNTNRVALSVVRSGATWDFIYAGTVSGNNVSMAATDPYVFQSGGSVIHFGSGIDIQNIQNNVGNGSLNVTGQCIQGCTGSCQTVWTGTWTKQ